MTSYGILQYIAKMLSSLTVDLLREKVKQRFKEPSSEELLLRWNELMWQLECESKLFVVRITNLIHLLEQPEKILEESVFDKLDTAFYDRLSLELQARYSYVVHSDEETLWGRSKNELSFQLKQSIDEIGKTLGKISKVSKRFSPILEVYNSEVQKSIILASRHRARVVCIAGEVLSYISKDETYNEIDKHGPELPNVDILKQIVYEAKDALFSINNSREKLQKLIRDTYPSIMDLPF